MTVVDAVKETVPEIETLRESVEEADCVVEYDPLADKVAVPDTV